MTKPKNSPHHPDPGQPPFPSLEIFIRVEALRRRSGKSLRAFCQSYELLMLTVGKETENRIITGEALRQHVVRFKRNHYSDPSPALVQSIENMIAKEMSLFPSSGLLSRN